MKKLFLYFLLAVGCLSPAFTADSPWIALENVFGRPGIEQEGLFKVAFSRTDLNVLVEGIPLEPEMALTTWFAFVQGCQEGGGQRQRGPFRAGGGRV